MADRLIEPDLEQLALKSLAGLGLVALVVAADQDRPGETVRAEAEAGLLGAQVAELPARQFNLVTSPSFPHVIIIAEYADDGPFLNNADRADTVFNQANRDRAPLDRR